jgi:hypothetical protein
MGRSFAAILYGDESENLNQSGSHQEAAKDPIGDGVAERRIGFQLPRFFEVRVRAACPPAAKLLLVSFLR